MATTKLVLLLSFAILIFSCHSRDSNNNTASGSDTSVKCITTNTASPEVCDKKRKEALADYSSNKMKYYVTGFLPGKKFVEELHQLNVQVVATSCVAMNNGDGCYNATIDSLVEARTGKSIAMRKKAGR
jgi:hypothetical protein